MALHTGTVGPVIRADNMEPEVLRQLVSVLSGERDGILRGTDFGVTQNGGGAMNVVVSSGLALITGTDSARVQGQYHVYNDANVTVTVSTANGSNPRVDLIVATIEDAYYAGGANTAILQCIAGTPGPSPAVPATPADSIVLAHIYVATSVGSILTAAINGTAGVNNPDTIAYSPLRAEGLLGKASGTGGTITSTVSPGTLVPGMTIAVNVPANRNIRVYYSVLFSNSASTTTQIFQVYRDGSGGTALPASQSYSGAGFTTGGSVSCAAIDSPSAGMHTYGLYGYSLAADTMTFANTRGTFTVEDCGPA